MKHGKGRHRLAALNFLSNISLDGTYRDTKYGGLRHSSMTNKSETVLFHKEKETCVYDPSKLKAKHTSKESTSRGRLGFGDLDAASSTSDVSDAQVLHITSRSVPPTDRRNSGALGTTSEAPGEDILVSAVRLAKPNRENASPTGKLRHHSQNFKILRAKSFTRKSFESLFTRQRHRSTSTSTSTDSGGVDWSTIPPIRGPLRRERGTNERLVFVTCCRKVPFTVFSVLPFNRGSQSFVRQESGQEGGRQRLTSSGSGLLHESLTSFGVIIKQGDEDTSYSHLMQPQLPKKRPGGSSSRRRLSVDAESDWTSVPSTSSISPMKEPEQQEPYRPHLLDDPELMAGRHRTVLNLPNYLTTVIEYVRPGDLKRDLNDQFSERFPAVQLTLTKMRSLKSLLLYIAKKMNIDLWTVGQAYVFFEKLILKNLVNKHNRKLCCAASLLLSAKLNDVKGQDLTNLVQELESTMRVSRRELLTYELAVFIALEFSLLSPDFEVYSHQQRLIQLAS